MKPYQTSRNLLLLAIVVGTIVIIGPYILGQIGKFLVKTDQIKTPADAAVVLNTGVDLPPRLMQAAKLFNLGLVKKIVINGDRKTDVIRKLEASGFTYPNEWHEDSIALLVFLGVPKDRIITISAQDAFDTISEAKIVGNQLTEQSIKTIIITTSKFHTRRANHIWQHLFGSRFQIMTIAAKDDPFQADGWWRSGRQIKQVLAEYGAWIFYWSNRLVIATSS